MAVARTTQQAFMSRESYEYWDGKCWGNGDCMQAAAMWKEIPQGAVFRSHMFGNAYPYVMVGVSKWADSKIRVGRAPTLIGPWEVEEVGRARGINYPDDYMYCIYPHPWVRDEKETLMVSWSEHWPGGVVMGKLNFVQDP